LASDQAGGGVQDPVAQRFGLGAGEVASQADELQPGGQVGGDRGQGAPGLVDREYPGGQVAEAGLFRAADPVFKERSSLHR
jgi:hypothetical protein